SVCWAAVEAGVTAALDVDGAHRLRTHVQREESRGRIGHVEAVEHVEYLIALSAGHVEVSKVVHDYTGIEAQQVANIACGWIWNVEYLTAVHGLAGSS